MQSDDMIWALIGTGKGASCSYKVKTPDEKLLCRNPYNATGNCARVFCPLANSQYATVHEFENKLYLYMKTPERSHLPLHQWKKLELPKNFLKAIKLIDEKLMWWSTSVRLKCKQRALRLSQMILRRQKAHQREESTELIEVRRKEESKLRSRERKSELAAKIETTISNELLKRLQEGVYDSVIEQKEEVLQQALKVEQKEEAKRKEIKKRKLSTRYAAEDLQDAVHIKQDGFHKVRHHSEDMEDISSSHGGSAPNVATRSPSVRRERVIIRRETQPKERIAELQLN
ncbi:mak-16-like RNA binding protein [Perkinsela sp. CCAP 1560/4]|nr:mak-16-like RNA binding protein [Perkinsela sp. CCAP 1560/4]|eukprot:KNH05274.1 mak-16-like RNA binding protein [Perkinsela sp. CCAP 1560/4]